MKHPKCVSILCSLLVGTCALAQSRSQFDLSGNLSFSGNNSAAVTGVPSKQVNSFGWQTSGDSHLNRWLSVTSEFGYGSADAGEFFGLTSPASASIHHYSLLGGPRIILPVRGRVSPFVEGLAGWDRASTKLTSNGITATGTDLEAAYAFGGGAQVALNRRISFRVQADYFATQHSTTFLGWEPSHMRVAGGIVIRVVGGRDSRQIADSHSSNDSTATSAEASNVEPKISEPVKPVATEAATTASVSPAAPAAFTAVIPPVPPTRSESFVDSNRQAPVVQQQAAAYAAPPAPKAVNPAPVMAGVVILTPAVKPAASSAQVVAPPASAPAIINTPNVVAAMPAQQAQTEGEPQSLGEYARRIRAKKSTSNSSW